MLKNTASKCSKDTDKLTAEVCCSDAGPDPNLAQLEYGRDTESAARTAYKKKIEPEHINISVQEDCGLVVCKEHVFIAVSPDGIVCCECHGEGLGNKIPRPPKPGVQPKPLLKSLVYLQSSRHGPHRLKRSQLLFPNPIADGCHGKEVMRLKKNFAIWCR